MSKIMKEGIDYKGEPLEEAIKTFDEEYFLNNYKPDLSNIFNKMTLKEAELFTSEFYRINISQFVEEYIKKKEQLLIYKFEKEKKYKFYYFGDLTAMLLWFKKDLKYHLQVQMTNTILKIAIKVNESYIIIIPYKAASDLYKEVISSEQFISQTKKMKNSS
jgi:hypothetical protein